MTGKATHANTWDVSIVIHQLPPKRIQVQPENMVIHYHQLATPVD